MNKKEIAPNIDFADATFKSCEMIEETLIIYVQSWDDKIIKIQFKNPIYFLFRIGSVISGAFEKLENLSILNEALSRYYEKVPINHQFKLYVLQDIDDFEFFEIVAENTFVIKE